MAKQCDKCKSYYPDELPACPQCVPAEGEGQGAGARTMVGGGPEATPGPDVDPNVDLGSPQELPSGPVSGSAVNLGELFKKQEQPKVPVEMPSSHKGSMLTGKNPPAGAASSSMLSRPAPTPGKGQQGGGAKTMLSDQGQPMDIPPEGSGSMLSQQHADDPETMVAKQAASPTQMGSVGQPTQMAPRAEPTQLASKATQLATGAAPQTKLAPPGAMQAMAEGKQPVVEDPKKTKMAAGAAQLTKMAAGHAPETKLGEGAAAKTKIAPPDEMKALLEGDKPSPKATKMAAGAAPITKMAAGAAPATKLASTAQTTKLASPEEMEALLRGEHDPKKTGLAGGAAPVTKMAAGAAPTTKLAPIDEMEQLARGGPKATKMAAGAAPDTRLAPLDEMEADAGVEPEDATAEAMLAEEEYEPMTAEVAEAPPPSAPVKKRSRTVPLLFGMILGTAACLALAVFDLLPVSALKDLVGIKSQVDDPAQALKEADGLVDGGQYAAALAILKNLDDNNPKVRALRGRARWMQYLARQDGLNLNKDDADVVQAREDFVAANNAEGIYWIGHMEEVLTGPEAGKAKHQEGLKKHPGGPNERMFNGGLDRIDTHSGAAGAQSRGPGFRNDEEAVAAALALFMVGFQAEPPAQPATGGAASEPGFDYWKATRLAKQQEYQQAIDALKAAIDIHKRTRFKRLGKAQNPISDPTKQIFLRASTDLLEYYQMKKMLLDDGYLEKGKPENTLQAFKSALDAGQFKEAGKTLADITAVLRKAGVIEDAKDIEKGVATLVGEHSEYLNIRKTLMDLGFVKMDQPGILEGFKLMSKDYDFKTTELATSTKLLMPKYVNEKQPLVSKGVETLVDDKKKTDIALADMTEKFMTVDGTLKGIVARLAKGEPPYLDPKTDTLLERDVIWAAVDKVMAEAYSPIVTALSRATRDLTKAGGTAGSRLTRDMDLGTNLALSQASNARLRTILMQSRTPHEMLAIWLPVLEEDRNSKDVAEKAALDARNVIKDMGAGAASHGQASAVQGLAQRNLGEYDAARASLETALKTEGAANLAWRSYARDAQRELTDPYAYFIPKAEALQADRQFEGALEFATKGVNAFKGIKKDGILLALRSVLRLDAAHAKINAPVDPKDPAIDMARKDATAAQAAGATAPASYALGRIAEELGQYAEAQKLYRAALAGHKDVDKFGSQIRIALARVLVKQREQAVLGNQRGDATPIVPAAEQKIETKPTILFHPLSAMVLVGQVGFDDDEFDPNDPALDEAIRLAEEAIKAGNYEGHLVKALALARKRRYTEAILEYSTGLSKLSKNPEHAAGLRKLMEMHPAFKIPDGLLPPDPLLAERHYSNGLRHYWARRYADAEGEFLSAVRYHDQDARYMYFLGLSRLNQGKREFALEAFRRGGLLESQKKPNRSSVSSTLERVQGGQRQLLNRYRP